MYRMNLKIARQKQHLTQQEMADKLGIGKQSYIRLELGYTDPTYGLVLKLNEMYPNEDIIELLKKEED